MLLTLKTQRYFRKYCEPRLVLKVAHAFADSFFAAFQARMEGSSAKPAGPVPEEALERGFFDAFHADIFEKAQASVSLRRPERRRVFESVVSGSYDFLSKASRAQKCSNNYFLSGDEAEDLLELFSVLLFDRAKYWRVPGRPVRDFHLDALLKFDAPERYRLVLESGEPAESEPPAQPALENQSFLSLANNPSFVCLDEALANPSAGLREVDVFFVAGNEGALKENFFGEIANIFKGNQRWVALSNSGPTSWWSGTTCSSWRNSPHTKALSRASSQPSSRTRERPPSSSRCPSSTTTLWSFSCSWRSLAASTVRSAAPASSRAPFPKTKLSPKQRALPTPRSPVKCGKCSRWTRS